MEHMHATDICPCMQMIRGADPKTRPQVLEILDSAKDLGLKVLRIWAFNEGPLQYNTLQRYPGQHQHHSSHEPMMPICASAAY